MATTENNLYKYHNASELAKFFHSVPHFDVQFKPVESDFNPSEMGYQESIVLIAAVPVIWMLTWMLIYMVYFCYFCVTCRKQRAKKNRKVSRPVHWFSFCFSILVLLSLTVAILGNEFIHYNVKSAESDLTKIKTDTQKAANQCAVVLHGLDVLILETASPLKLKKAFEENSQLAYDTRLQLANLSNKLIGELDDVKERMEKMVKPALKKIKTENKLSGLIMEYETYRRLASHSLSAFVMLVTCLSLCSLGGKRKGFILACLALAIFEVILIWAASGFYFGLTVTTSDLCMDPTDYINRQRASSPMTTPGAVSVTYYLECQTNNNPFYENLIRIQTELTSTSQRLSKMLEFGMIDDVRQNITTAKHEVEQLQQDILRLSSLTDCTHSHRNYVSAINSICTNALIGETAMFSSYTLAGIFIIILVFLIHAVARYTGNRRAYFEVDSQDNDYQSRDQHNRSDNPLYYRFSQISGADDNIRPAISASPQPTAPARSSPPPAYQNHRDFYSTYGNNGTMDSNTRMPVVSNDLNRNSNTFRT